MKKRPKTTPLTVAERKLVLDVQRIRRIAQGLRLSGTMIKTDELIEQIRYEATYFPWPKREPV